MPNAYIRDAGAWKVVKGLYARDAGSWKTVKAAWVRDAGAWKQFYQNVFAFSITSDTANANLRTLANAAGYTGAGDCTITIDTLVDIYSTSSSTAACVPGSWPSGVTVTLIINGTVSGAGGKGGDSGWCVVNPGSNGGVALSASGISGYTFKITNNGTIRGGGGGGSGGISVSPCPCTGAFTYPGGGGGGGQGHNGGGGGTAAGGASNGSAGSPSAPGSGGVSPSGGNCNGGNGGGWGADGAGLATGGAHSTGGNAVTGNANITWNATGTRTGAVS